MLYFFPLGAREKYGVDIGDNAIAENIVPCWECRYCLRGKYNMCKFKHSWPVSTLHQVIFFLCDWFYQVNITAFLWMEA